MCSFYILCNNLYEKEITSYVKFWEYIHVKHFAQGAFLVVFEEVFD